MAYANEFHDAVAAVKTAFKWALDNDVDDQTTGELWRHYQGLKTISASKKPVETFGVDFGDLNVGIDSDYYGAAGTVPIQGGAGSDVITFGA
ncbi:hypothetical protein PTIM40_212 [Cyanophage P-TIM40]|uniref:Uncharacterized protein n=1 Tax=Cyanophage P-TIM40 TaxID=1589733 RepID=A0A0C5AED7_9CAUD|nr:hypothetical protein AU107_gp229 [Cyanophage P-TIM40]AJK27624.1 hypothetical protein PTIM40_212 [Cyanophage P-TIM40]|tara:strand:+ start:837 stop:1112 length:276 start_codon:yes stop_codon:yes gene_type:complete